MVQGLGSKVSYGSKSRNAVKKLYRAIAQLIRLEDNTILGGGKGLRELRFRGMKRYHTMFGIVQISDDCLPVVVVAVRL